MHSNSNYPPRQRFVFWRMPCCCRSWDIPPIASSAWVLHMCFLLNPLSKHIFPMHGAGSRVHLYFFSRRCIYTFKFAAVWRLIGDAPHISQLLVVQPNGRKPVIDSMGTHYIQWGFPHFVKQKGFVYQRGYFNGLEVRPSLTLGVG